MSTYLGGGGGDTRTEVVIDEINVAEVEIKNDAGNPVPTAPDVALGGGAITAKTQRVTLATDGPTVAALGAPADAAATTDTGTFSIISLVKRGLQNWTTLLARVPSLTVTSNRLLTDGSGVVQPVSDNSGSLTVDGRSYRSTVSITRPSNTTTYTAGDVIGAADGGTPANAGSAILTLTNAGPSGGFILLQSIALVFSDAAVISGMAAFRVHLYSASPTAILDNAVFDLVSGDRASYMGYVDLPAPVDLGSTIYTQADYPGRLVRLGTSSTSLFAQIQTIGGYQPASGSTIELRVNAIEMGL